MYGHAAKVATIGRDVPGAVTGLIAALEIAVKLLDAVGKLVMLSQVLRNQYMPAQHLGPAFLSLKTESWLSKTIGIHRCPTAVILTFELEVAEGVNALCEDEVSPGRSFNVLAVVMTRFGFGGSDCGIEFRVVATRNAQRQTGRLDTGSTDILFFKIIVVTRETAVAVFDAVAIEHGNRVNEGRKVSI